MTTVQTQAADSVLTESVPIEAAAAVAAAAVVVPVADHQATNHHHRTSWIVAAAAVVAAVPQKDQSLVVSAAVQDSTQTILLQKVESASLTIQTIRLLLRLRQQAGSASTQTVPLQMAGSVCCSASIRKDHHQTADSACFVQTRKDHHQMAGMALATTQTTLLLLLLLLLHLPSSLVVVVGYQSQTVLRLMVLCWNQKD